MSSSTAFRECLMSRAHHRLLIPMRTGVHSFRISSGRGGTAPPESAHRCYAPVHKLRSSSGRGGNAPPESANRWHAPLHKLRSSSGRGGNAPSGCALASCARASAASRAAQAGTPRLSQSVRSARYSLPVAARPTASARGPASGSALVPYALPARTRTLTHLL